MGLYFSDAFNACKSQFGIFLLLIKQCITGNREDYFSLSNLESFDINEKPQSFKKNKQTDIW